jgi:hypothetical protein
MCNYAGPKPFCGDKRGMFCLSLHPIEMCSVTYSAPLVGILTLFDCVISPWLDELPQKAKGICHLVIQCATSVGRKKCTNQNPKMENPSSTGKVCSFLELKHQTLKIGGSFKNIPSKA